MATTWLKALHTGKKRARSTIISDIIDYVNNPQKTDNGNLITSYGCDSRTADDEFILAKRDYEFFTGRDQGKHDVIAYHIRQSFRPGEIDAETANRIGYELAMSFTKAAHAFVVATHIDRRHIHNHIIFNSTTLPCDRKFSDFKRSAMVVRRISDLLCLENGLSVIENPKPSKGRNYGEWLGGKPPTWQEKLRRKIDEVLPSCSSFEDFILAMITAEYTVNQKRKHITFLAPGQKQPTRLDTLRGDHTEAAIRERLAGTRIITASGSGKQHNAADELYQTGHTRVSLLIDIQDKIREGKGEGYERWARIFNIKEAARTLMFLQENGIDSYDDLVKKTAAATADFDGRMAKIKAAEKRMAEITELQKQIGTYGKTREIYAKYKASGWNPEFYEEHRAEITLHRAAKNHFDKLKIKKLPTIASLKQEYAALAADKKKLYIGYHEAKDNMRQLLVARGNAARILGIDEQTQERERSRKQSRSGTPDR